MSPHDFADPPELKDHLRRRIRQARRATRRDASESARLTESWRSLRDLCDLTFPGSVALFISSAGEPDTSDLRAVFRAAGTAVLLPRALPERKMEWVIDDATEQPNTQYSTLKEGGGPLVVGDEDLSVDVAFIPAIAADRSGSRLGQGGGYYDVWLAQLRTANPSALVVAVVHPNEIFEANGLPRESHDHVVDVIMTVDEVVLIAAPDPR